MIINCPKCSVSIIFESDLSKSFSCTSCNTLVKKDSLIHYDSFKSIQLREDMSPIKIGTMGEFERKPFTIRGRVQYHFRSSYHNYWLGYFTNQTWFYLTEGYGTYTFTCPSNNTLKIKNQSELKPGKTIKISPYSIYVIDQITECTSMALEGEFPFNIEEFKPFFLLEASNDASEIQSFHLLPGQQRAFQSKCLEFDDFNFTNLRNLNGWN